MRQAMRRAGGAKVQGERRRSARLLAIATDSTSSLDTFVEDKLPRVRRSVAAKPKTKAPSAKFVRQSKSKPIKADDEKDTSSEQADAAESAIKFPHGTLPQTYEAAKIAKGFTRVVGVDEAGRGPLAGPVVAAACFVPTHVTIEGVHDSKKLNEAQREALYAQLVAHPEIEYAVHVNSAQRIDEINILQASLESMVLAAQALPQGPPDFVFVDGNRMPPTLTIAAETVVKGDSKVYSIAAASIIAKVTRDRLMLKYDAQFPVYGLKQHKGYPTQAHMAAIAKHGPCAIHRMTFAPLKPKQDKKKCKK